MIGARQAADSAAGDEQFRVQAIDKLPDGIPKRLGCLRKDAERPWIAMYCGGEQGACIAICISELARQSRARRDVFQNTGTDALIIGQPQGGGEDECCTMSTSIGNATDQQYRRNSRADGNVKNMLSSAGRSPASFRKGGGANIRNKVETRSFNGVRDGLMPPVYEVCASQQAPAVDDFAYPETYCRNFKLIVPREPHGIAGQAPHPVENELSTPFRLRRRLGAVQDAPRFEIDDAGGNLGTTDINANGVTSHHAQATAGVR